MDDEILACYMTMLQAWDQDKDDQIYDVIASTIFSKNLENDVVNDDVLRKFDPWLATKTDLTTKRRFFIPIYQPGHWVLMVIYRPDTANPTTKGCIFVWDSLRGPQENEQPVYAANGPTSLVGFEGFNTFFTNLAPWLRRHCRRRRIHGSKDYNICNMEQPNIYKTYSMPCARQKNNDCGMFLLQNAEALYKNRTSVPWNDPSKIKVSNYIDSSRTGAEHVDRNRAVPDFGLWW